MPAPPAAPRAGARDAAAADGRQPDGHPPAATTTVDAASGIARTSHTLKQTAEGAGGTRGDSPRSPPRPPPSPGRNALLVARLLNLSEDLANPANPHIPPTRRTSRSFPVGVDFPLSSPCEARRAREADTGAPPAATPGTKRGRWLRDKTPDGGPAGQDGDGKPPPQGDGMEPAMPAGEIMLGA